MNENLVTYNLQVFDPDTAGGAIGTSAWLGMVPFAATLVYASVSPHEDDASATIDIQDDGTDIVTAIAAATHATPGEWISTHCGGTQTPVAIAAGSELEIDVNSGAATTRLDVTLIFLQGAGWG